ncbi:RNA polymerase sigma factor [Pedobacter faecalis]|uniref:RNA polymerase sigma factor n=1 Tax=Pedobacter faecalis TaxID=3041495 RepID=UPI002549C280|nr:sigma-70 family RNA polymerase sigma factor [Pedobacter sp. ELA7]
MGHYLPDEEKDLLLRIAEGDELAFGLVFRAYYPKLFTFISRMDPRGDDVDEAIQETFIRVWLSRDQLPGILNFRGWLYTIATREAIAIMRKNLLKQRTSDRLLSAPPVLSGETPADLTQARQIRELVEQAIARMPPSRRRIYQMSREEGLKPAEIASQLDLSVSTVKNTLVTALQDIRKFLVANGQTIPLLIILLVY